MMELRPGKMQELKNPETDTFKDIRPRQEKTAQDRLNQFNEMFIKSEWGGDYTTYNERLSRTLKNDTFLGQYEGERGESKFIPSDATEAGRKAYLAGLGRVLTRGASASDPLTGFLRN